MTRTIGILFAAVLVIGLGLLAIYMVDVDQTREARLPNVDVNVKGGQAPKFDVETGDIKVTEEKATVPVPEVEMKEEQVTVPGVEVTPPERDSTDNDNAKPQQ